MAAEHPTRDAFIAAIEAKIAAWNAVLDSYRAAASLDGPIAGDHAVIGQPRQASHASHDQKPIDLPVGVFRDKSLKEAIQIYLGAGRRKQTNKEIAIGLQKGGIPTTANFFEATVSTALARMKDEGLVLRFPDGWDLASSYPDSLRNRLEKDAKPRTKRTAKANKAKTDKPTTSKTGRADKTDKTAAILAFIEGRNQGTSIDNVIDLFKSKGTDCSRDYVRVVTKRLAERGNIEIRDGQFYPKIKLPF